MCLNCGQMDREIVIQTATRSIDPVTGQPIFTWDTGETIWAQWLPAGSKETWQAQQRFGSYVDGVFRIHDRSPRPTPDTTRIVFDGKTFDVKPYVEIGRGEALDVPAVARGEV